MKRPDWDSIWMDVALTIAKRSHHPDFKVGAIVVTSDNTQVLAIGYNGNASGMKNCIESDVPGESGLIHAEINALLKLDYNNPKVKKMYLTLSPCEYCAKCIVNSGISEVVYLESYRDLSGVNILNDAEIACRKYL